MAKTPKRPRDPNQLAKLIVDIATSEQVAEAAPSEPRGSPGGQGRARKLSAEERGAIARKAAAARWKTDSPAPDEKARP